MVRATTAIDGTTLVLKSVIEAADSRVLEQLKPDFFQAVLSLVRDRISQQATKAALKVLLHACAWGRNRIKIVEAGGVKEIVELETTAPEKWTAELNLEVPNQLCASADGVGLDQRAMVGDWIRSLFESNLGYMTSFDFGSTKVDPIGEQLQKAMGEEEERDPQRLKRIAAAAYDYDNDPRWAEYWSNVLIPPHMAARSDVVDHFKRKFYQRFIVRLRSLFLFLLGFSSD
ncbi:hypothetical protein BHM03_00029876 [Ensete ventricosum]|nr:hypothetical protein BHM03_00029876 [Ensete ventricosum]